MQKVVACWNKFANNKSNDPITFNHCWLLALPAEWWLKSKWLLKPNYARFPSNCRHCFAAVVAAIEEAAAVNYQRRKHVQRMRERKRKKSRLKLVFLFQNKNQQPTQRQLNAPLRFRLLDLSA